jgi:F-type H+-transporting ATPase subunit c
MKKYASFLFATVAVLLLAPAVFAQAAAAEPAAGGVNWKIIATAAGMAVAAAFCGLAQSRVASAACEGMARNPGAADVIRGAMILGLVFIETLVLFTLAMIYLNA